MANTIIAPQIFSKETLRNLDREVILLASTNRGYEWDIKQAWDTVRVQTLPTIAFTASSVSGAGTCATSAVGTWPWGVITASDFTITLESLIVDKYTEKRVTITDHEATQSNLALTSKVASRFAEGMGTLLDDQVRDQILVTQVADIPAANKINSASPVVLTATNVYGEIMKLRSALKKQNVKTTNMELYVSVDVESVLLQSDFLVGSDAGATVMKTGFLGTVGGIPVYTTTALDASNEMIMMAKGSVNAVIQITKLKVMEADDGFYTNVLATIVWGMKIFWENAKAIAINYVASVS